MFSALFALYLKMLVLYSPFFVLSCFIGLTPGYSVKERKKLAWKVALGTLIASVLLYLFGQTIFEIFLVVPGLKTFCVFPSRAQCFQCRRISFDFSRFASPSPIRRLYSASFACFQLVVDVTDRHHRCIH